MDTGSLVLDTLADASLRALGIGIAAGAALLVLRARVAAVRHAVWTAVLSAMLLLPMLSAVLPELPLNVLRPVPQVSQPAVQYAAPVAVTTAPITLPATPVPAAPLWTWQRAVVCAYLAVTLVLAVRMAVGYFFMRRLVRNSAPVDLVCAGVNARLLDSLEISVPLTLGWRRPVILLPSEWTDWTPEKLHAVLAHETAHVARADWLIAMLAGLNRCVFWFHPLAWWLERKLAALAEEACDEHSLEATGDRRYYAGVLLEMAQAVRSGNGRVAVAMARHSDVRRRIETILDESRRLSPRMTKTRWAAVLLSLAPLVYGAAAVQLHPATGQDPAAPVHASTVPGGTGRGVPLPLNMTPTPQVSDSEAAEAERAVQSNPDDIAARARLIAYYFRNANREARLKQIFWMIEHHPDAECLATESAVISEGGGILNSAEDYARADALWTEQIARNPNSVEVLSRALQVFARDRGGERTSGRAMDLAKRLRSLEPENVRWTETLGVFYALEIAKAKWNPERALRARRELDSSTDAALLAAAATALSRTFSRPDERQEFEAYGAELRQRAQALGQGALPGSGATRGPILLHRVEPEYAPLAKQARIQGVVRLRLKVGKDGHVLNAQLLGGHPLLVPAAVAAARQYFFAAALRDGVEVDGTADVEVPFTVASTERPARDVGGSSLTEARVTHKVEPEYPPLARQARVSGTVRVDVWLGSDGRPKSVRAKSGPPLLRQAAVDAVRQWVWEPARVNGQPAELATEVDVAFALGNPQIPLPAPTETGDNAQSSGHRLGNVTPARVISKVQPVYPPLARQARVSGTVRVEALVGADGKVKSATALSGPPLLREAAEATVRQWVYEPARLNGQPQEVTTQMDVAFALGSPAPGRIRVGSNVQQANLIEQPSPVYPPLARQARIQGTVRFDVVIGVDGRVLNLTLVSGHPLLVPAAQQAVQQWVYRPTLLNGVAMEVVTSVDVNFVLEQ